MPTTFKLPAFSVRVQIALMRARMIAKHNFRLAVARLVEVGILIDSAIAIVARLCGAAAARAGSAA